MANVTFDLLWRECMRELLDLLELEQPPEDFGSWKEDQVISHFSYLYIRYVLLYTSLEDCMDQHVHAQKRKDIQAAVESVMRRIDSGQWSDTSPAALNTLARTLDPGSEAR